MEPVCDSDELSVVAVKDVNADAVVDAVVGVVMTGVQKKFDEVVDEGVDRVMQIKHPTDIRKLRDDATTAVNDRIQAGSNLLDHAASKVGEGLAPDSEPETQQGVGLAVIGGFALGLGLVCVKKLYDLVSRQNQDQPSTKGKEPH